MLASGVLAGAGLAVVAVAGTSLIARGAGEAGIVAAALLASLIVGLWAGAPAAGRDELPLRERWVGAGTALAAAGAVATLGALYSAAALTSAGRVLALLALVAAPGYTLGLIFPPLLAGAERALEDIDEHASGWGPLADVVVGTLAGAAVVMGAGGLLLPAIGAPPLFLAAALLVVAPLLFPLPDRSGPREDVLHETDSAVGTLRVTEVRHPGERQPERRLYLNEEQESGELVRSGAPTLAYVAAAEAWLTSDATPGSRYLFLGGGAYTLPRRIAERDPRASITVVEIDPEVTRLAYRFFGLRRDHGITTVHGDARAYLEHGPPGSFNRIYIDVYGGQESLPYHLVTREALAALRERLGEGGVVGINLIGRTHGAESVRTWSVVRTAADAFGALALYTHLGPEYPERQNLLLLAAPDPAQAFPARIAGLERWPAEEWRSPPEAGVLRDLYLTSAARGGVAASESRPGNAG